MLLINLYGANRINIVNKNKANTRKYNRCFPASTHPASESTAIRLSPAVFYTLIFQKGGVSLGVNTRVIVGYKQIINKEY